MRPDTFDNFNNEEFINWLVKNRYFKQEGLCCICNTFMILKNCKRNKDFKAWRSTNVSCNRFKQYTSIRPGSLFEHFTLPIKRILIVQYLCCSIRTPIIS